MPFTNITGQKVALTLENAESIHLQRQVETYRLLTGRHHARTIPLHGGIAAFTEPIFGRKLNHVTGLGMGTSVSTEGVGTLERAYAASGLDVEIDLCPHADVSLLRVLADRGYTAVAFSNTYAYSLTKDGETQPLSTDFEIIDDRAEIAKIFVDNSLAGFAEQRIPRPAILLQTLAQIALARADTRLYAARLNGIIVATAGMSILETAGTPVAHLYIASTLPAYRSRGLQLALLKARLVAARQAGCILASVTARPENASARNAERAGFKLAYTKTTFLKRCRDIATT